MSSKDNSNKKTKRKRKNPFRFFFFDFVKVTGSLSALCWILPKRLYENKNARKPVRKGGVVIANHTGITDPIALYCAYWYRRPHIIAFKELFEKKIGNWFFRKMGCIPVDRDNFGMDTYRAAQAVLAENRLLCLFPEGAINHDRQTIQSFKSGAALMALKGKAPILPVYIAPRKRWYNRTVMVIGEPIDIVKLYAEKGGLRGIDEVTQIVHEKEIKLMEIYNTWKTKKSSK